MNKPWYEEGLRFGCTGCGRCCSGDPGYVFLKESEMFAIARHLEISIETFVERYTKRVGRLFSLREIPAAMREGFDCVFLRENRCSIYEVRPTQCRTYPFWPAILASRSHWERERHACEGIHSEDAPLIDVTTIQTLRNDYERITDSSCNL